MSDVVDMSQPLYLDSVSNPLPDRPYKDVLTAADKSLKQKEKGPWGQLTIDEKIACRFLNSYNEHIKSSESYRTLNHPPVYEHYILHIIYCISNNNQIL